MSSAETTENPHSNNPRLTNLGEAIFIVCFLILSIITTVNFFPDDAISGPVQLALFFTAFVGIVIGMKNGFHWKDIEAGISHTTGMAANACFILFSVGALVGTWILCGTVPTLVYYGLKLLSPEIFYVSACIICALVSISIGSSWTTIATVGVALAGISNVLGLSLPITAGAIVSGAYFGDKMSPLSDTTNMAPAVSGSELFSHIRHMMWVSIPSFIIALILYMIIGFTTVSDSNEAINLSLFTESLEAQFSIGLHLLLPLIILLGMAIKKVPALPAVFLGAILGAIFALIFQQKATLGLLGNPESDSFFTLLKGVILALFNGYSSSSGVEAIDSLLSKGGMADMANTVWLVLSAMLMAGILNKIGVLKRIVMALTRITKGVGSLIATTLANSFIMNILSGEQYISIVIPGQMWKDEYRRRKLAAVNLSRCLEDAGTLTSPLVPWTSCGAYVYGILSLSSLAYIPFCFFNIINPFLSAIYGFIGFTIKTLDEEEAENRNQESGAGSQESELKI